MRANEWPIGRLESDLTSPSRSLLSRPSLSLQIYTDFRAAESVGGVDELSWLCSSCAAVVRQAREGGAAPASINVPHCRRSETEEESQEVRFQRMMHMLMAFYKSVEPTGERGQ